MSLSNVLLKSSYFQQGSAIIVSQISRYIKSVLIIKISCYKLSHIQLSKVKKGLLYNILNLN